MRNILVALICIFASKIVFLHGTLAETLGLFAFVAFAIASEHYQAISKVDEFKKDMEEHAKQVAHLTKSLDEVKTSVSALRMASGFKQVNNK